MSLFSRLFGKKTGAERIAEAVRLLESGEAGLARMELEAALGDSDLDAETRSLGSAKLVEASDAVATARIADAEALLDAGDIDDAHDALDIALSVGPSESLAKRARRLLDGDRRTLSAPVAGGGAKDRPAPVVEAVPVEAAGPSAEELEMASGLSSLELSLLALTEDDAEHIRDLVDADPALREAIELAHRGQSQEAAKCFSALGGATATDSLVRREHARASLAAGDGKEACSILAALDDRGDDPEVLELLMEARVATGDPAGAGELADRMLSTGDVRDLAATLAVLSDAGRHRDALGHLERSIAGQPKEVALWEMRAVLLGRLGNAGESRDAAGTALDHYRAQCVGCGGGRIRFPVSAAAIVAVEMSARDLNRQDRAALGDLLRLLTANDPGGRERWQSMQGALESSG